MTDFGTLLPLLRREIRSMAWTFIVAVTSLLTLATIAALSAGIVGRAIVDGVGPPGSVWAALIGLVVLRALLTWHEMDVSHSLAYRVLHRLRMALFDGAVVQREPGHSARRTAVAMTDTERLEFFYAHTIAQLGASAVAATAAVVAASVFSTAAAAAATCGVILVALSSLWGRQKAKELGWRRAQRLDLLATSVTDSLAGRREIIVFRLAERLCAQVSSMTDQIGRVDRRLARLQARVNGGREFLVTLTLAGTVLAMAVEATVNPAMAPAIVVLALAGATSADAAAATIVQVSPLAASARRVAEGCRIEARGIGSVSATGGIGLPEGALGLTWSSIDVDYGRGPSLGGHDGSIAPGEHIAIAGPSGSGKSTLMSVLARLTNPTSGDVQLVDAHDREVDLASVDEAQLRSVVAVVAQEPILFHGTVRMNLALGAENPSETELQRGLESVGGDEFTSLDSLVGEQGVGLSGGQIARIALARALIGNPRILLIDELTAALDEATESRILDIIDRFAGTVVCVSHRRATLARFSRVIHLDPKDLSRRNPE